MTREKEIAYIAFMAALIAVLRLVPAIPLPTGVPISAQSLGVMLAGTLLGAKRGFLAVLLFVALALIGLPVLSSGITGFAIFTAPTVGFVLGFPIAAFVTGLVMESMRSRAPWIAASASSFIGCVIVLYICGILGFAVITGRGLWESTAIMAIYIPGDIIKTVIAGLITAMLVNLRPEVVLTR